MAFQHLLFQKSTRCQGPFDASDVWSRFGERISINKMPTPARMLQVWRKMLKHKVPVDPHSLKPINFLRKPAAEWQLDPKTWGQWMSTSPIYLLGMLRRSRNLKATDPRDRVYATLNLVIDYDDDGEPLDYTKSMATSYAHIASLLPFKCNSLQFLADAKLPRNPDPRAKGLPTWAPNWNLPGNASYFHAPFCAAGDLPMYAWPFHQDIHDGILYARGFQYSTVEWALSDIDNSLSTLSTLFNNLIFGIKLGTRSTETLDTLLPYSTVLH